MWTRLVSSPDGWRRSPAIRLLVGLALGALALGGLLTGEVNVGRYSRRIIRYADHPAWFLFSALSLLAIGVWFAGQGWRAWQHNGGLPDGATASGSTVGRAAYLRSRLVQAGLMLFVLGSGPLISVMVYARLGFYHDPDPNPVALGILAGLTLWPSVILIGLGVWRVRRRDIN